MGVGEAGDPVGGGREQDPVAVVGGLDAESDREVGLAGAGRAEEDDVAGLGEEPSRCQRSNLLTDGGLGVEVEVVESLASAEPGLPDAHVGAGGVTCRDFAFHALALPVGAPGRPTHLLLKAAAGAGKSHALKRFIVAAVHVHQSHRRPQRVSTGAPFSRLTDLIREAKRLNADLGTELEKEVRHLQERRAFGLNFERHAPEAVDLYGRPVRVGDKVRMLPPPGQTASSDKGVWLVTGGGTIGGQRRADLRDPKIGDTANHPVEDLVIALSRSAATCW